MGVSIVGPESSKMYGSRRTAYGNSRSSSTTSTTSRTSTSSMRSETDIRKQSLREMPSYRDEASKALNRRDDLTDLKRRLSSNRDLLNADHASKPWLKFRSVSQKSLDLEQVKEDSGQAYPVNLENPHEIRQKSSSSVFSSAASPAKIIAPSVVMSARPAKYSRTNNDNYYNY